MSMTMLDTLIHLGAGPCRELDAHLALQPKRLILVEADARLADALKARTHEREHVSVRKLAVASQPDQVTFHRYNLPGAGSLQPATGLKVLFPGLKLQQTLTLEAVGICDLIGSLQLTPDAHHRLVLDLPGQELSSLQALDGSGQLYHFQSLSMYCGHEPLYEYGVSAEIMLDWLTNKGFDLVKCDKEQDPDLPCWMFQRNQLKLECIALQNRLHQVVQDHVALSAVRDEQIKLAAERQQHIEALIAEKSALVKDQATLSATRDEQARLAAEHQQQIEALNAEKAALIKDKTALKVTCDEQTRLASERQQQIEKLNAENIVLAKDKTALKAARDEQTKLNKALQAEIKSLKTQFQEQQKRVNKLESQLTERDQRQSLMDEELHKAEGQIELIKDLLLHKDLGQ